jgi:hypothetical protein
MCHSISLSASLRAQRRGGHGGLRSDLHCVQVK